jgi:hypothetical protein
MTRFIVESVEVTRAAWGEIHVANIRIQNDVMLYRIGPAYSEMELVQMVLDRFGARA